MRLDFTQALAKTVKFLLIAYALICVAYTTKNLYSARIPNASHGGVLYPRAASELERSVAQDTLGTTGAMRTSMKWSKGNNQPDPWTVKERKNTDMLMIQKRNCAVDHGRFCHVKALFRLAGSLEYHSLFLQGPRRV